MIGTGLNKGTVVFSDRYGGYEKLAVIAHPNCLTTHYGHSDSISVRTGQYIRASQVLGTVGSTRRVTGPHLHFEIRKNSTPRDAEIMIPNLTTSAER
jgi:murein DD-endopeptidase MepM/ murein hydrolase activator NlpD